MKANKIAVALGLVGTIGLYGCGDSGGGSSGSVVDDGAAQTYTVKAIDGYLQNAKVWLDINRNFLLDDGEPTTTSGEGGVAKLDVSGIAEPEQYPVVVQAIAGQTVDEDEPDAPITSGFMMSAPAGEDAVTPLSTLVHIYLEDKVKDMDMTAPDLTQLEEMKEQAVQQVAGELGIDESEVLGDFNELDDPEAVEEIAYITKSIVTSNAVLPETPQEMADTVEEVKEADGDTVSDFEKNAQVINDVIKDTVEEVSDSGGDLAVTDPISSVDTSSDNDGDGVPNAIDKFPDDPSEYQDSDHDGIGNKVDTDDDNDGINDTTDQYPTDSTRAGDFDHDGIDLLDDLYPNDTDNDGYNNDDDIFDNDPTEWADDDGDGLGDNKVDPYPNDTDNDGHNNDDDLFDNDPTEWADNDNDGLGDNSDTDDDNDGFLDTEDAFPNDPDEYLDSDGDGTGNNSDNDDDGDGTLDGDDQFPLDPTESQDSDGDGVGDNSDAFPHDGTESVDTDSDGKGDNSDNCPTVSNNDQQDSDGDGIGDVCDTNTELNWDNANWDEATWQ
ncbi:hypothetical protein [Vibrio maerlii]|uniref:hypothetical protein n=1 Tax=Vibrio maerlii TaxID=2231648 RepID=UPI000E3D35CF|nr:hypothetical protein [Vibrio maerlii]